MKTKQGYKYKKADSILGLMLDEYSLTESEFYQLYSFYVTYSMCGAQSMKKRTFVDYGWQDESIKDTMLGCALKNILNLNHNSNFIFTDKDKLGSQFISHDLPDGAVKNVDYERAVIVKNSEPNNYLQLFYRVRDGLAHGRFKLRYSSSNAKMVVLQDNDRYNVTARIVISLDTLLRFVQTIDLQKII